MCLQPTEVDLENRRPVWEVLAHLFLDIEWPDQELRAFAKDLVTSSYTVTQLRAILYREVYPACSWNLSVGADIAGDQHVTIFALEPRVMANQRFWRRWRSWRFFQFKRSLVEPTWRRLVAMIRAEAPPVRCEPGHFLLASTGNLI